MDGGRANVDMMHQTANFNYTEDRTFQLIQLPYGNQAFSMMVLLPLEGISLGEAVTVLNGDGYWGGLQSRLSDTEAVSYTHLDVYKRQHFGFGAKCRSGYIGRQHRSRCFVKCSTKQPTLKGLNRHLALVDG